MKHEIEGKIEDDEGEAFKEAMRRMYKKNGGVRITSKGCYLPDTKGKTIFIKYPTEEELLEIKHMIYDEVKKQKQHENNN